MDCAICGADAWYVCGKSGRPVCPQHSRIEVVSKLSFGSSDGLMVQEATAPDYAEMGELAEYFLGGSSVKCWDDEYDILKMPAYVVATGSHIAGVMSYSLEPDCLRVILLDVLPGYQGLGAGSMLLDVAKCKASAERKPVIEACASNDDLPAIYFYQKNGFRIYDVKPNVVAERQGGLQVGFAGIPSQDDIRLRFVISDQ